MEDVSETVEIIEVPVASAHADNTRNTKGFPPSFGILAEQKLQNDLKIYGEMYGVEITGQRIDQSKKNLEIPGLIETEPYNIEKLETALKEGKPITFFNALTDIPMYNKEGTDSGENYSRHWVNIVGKEGDKMNISTWGEERMLKYGDLQEAQRTKDLKDEDTGLVIKKTMEYLFADREVFEFVYAPPNASYIFGEDPNIMIYFNTNTEYEYSLSGGQNSQKPPDPTKEYEVDYDAYFHGYDQWGIVIISKESEERWEGLDIIFSQDNIIEKETEKEFDLLSHIKKLNKMEG